MLSDMQEHLYLSFFPQNKRHCEVGDRRRRRVSQSEVVKGKRKWKNRHKIGVAFYIKLIIKPFTFVSNSIPQ
jgi:hypothetical protein